MIDHVVALRCDATRHEKELAKIMAGLAALVNEIEGFVGFSHGPNIDLEAKSQDYPYGFICRFADQAALERYAIDPRHQAFGARLVALCDHNADNIIVFDIQHAST